jgi:hypothetical protein
MCYIMCKLCVLDRAEAAASQEAAEAERAAKFVAEAEAQATQGVLERMQSSMEAERSMAVKVGLGG